MSSTPRLHDPADLRALLHAVAEAAADYYDGLDARPVVPRATAGELREAFDVPLSERGVPAQQVFAELVAAADPGIVSSAGSRYFGFVIGGSVPAALAADWMATAWDQNAGLYVAGPAASVVEEVAGAWLLEILGLPKQASFGFVTGGQMANTTALAVARHELLANAGWDVERDGLCGAPRIQVVVGAKRHGTIDRALRFLGLGLPTKVVAADDQGRMRIEDLSLGDAPTIVCAQVGEVNTGACDPIDAIADACAAAPNTWLHVDGAFGLWASASDRLRPLVHGVERADSWATDAHKWLNVPYDSGIVFCAHPAAHARALSATGSYLLFDDETRDQVHWNPEHSRRARGFAVYAALRSLGRQGIAELVEGCCEQARRLADGLRELGADVLNDVVLNQVLFRFETDEATENVLSGVQASGVTWMGGTSWDERRAIRLSVSSWQTAAEDVERTLEAIGAAAAARPSLSRR